jgi:hypothetical protein
VKIKGTYLDYNRVRGLVNQKIATEERGGENFEAKYKLLRVRSFV